VLMPEIAALGQTAHVQIIMAVRVPEMRATSTDNGRCLPLSWHAPGMQDAVALVNHRKLWLTFDNRTLIRIAHEIKSHYAPGVNRFIEASCHGVAPVVH
jgi:hypothetical protein